MFIIYTGGQGHRTGVPQGLDSGNEINSVTAVTYPMPSVYPAEKQCAYAATSLNTFQ